MQMVFQPLILPACKLPDGLARAGWVRGHDQAAQPTEKSGGKVQSWQDCPMPALNLSSEPCKLPARYLPL